MKVLGKKSASSFLKTALNLAWYLGIAAAALIVLSQIYFIIASPPPFSGNMMMQIQVPGMVFRFTEGLTEPASPALFVLQFTLILPLLAIGLLVVYQLRKILATLVDAAPFTSENGHRMRIIGFAVIAATLLKTALGFLLGIYLTSMINLPGLELNANIRAEDFGGVFLGAIILILAEVFRQGARLQEDQDLTV